MKETLLGLIALGEKRSDEPYSGTDLRLLKSVATQTGLALANAQLTSAIAVEVGRREKMNREIEIAREVQERLFPQKLPLSPEWIIADVAARRWVSAAIITISWRCQEECSASRWAIFPARAFPPH
jgi:hypothetical protein